MKKKTRLFLSLLWALFLLTAPAAHAAGTITFHLRYQSDMVFEDSWPLPDLAPVNIQDKAGVAHTATSTSALAVLLDVDKAKDSFAVSDLAYFDSFKSFLVNCISVAKGNTKACFDWHYAVNGVLPSVGVDQYLLKAGDDVFFFFGSHRVAFRKDAFYKDESFVATAQNYLYQTNEWTPLPNVTIGITKDNPSDPFSPLVVATLVADAAGKASFTLQTEGTYHLGIAEDFYFPLFELTIVAPQVNPGGGSFFESPPHHRDVDVQKTMQFFLSHQNPDGSFGNASLFSDWTAIAFGAYEGNNPAKAALVHYLLGDPSPGNLVSDDERRAMALMALSINPYTGTKTNYIQKILDGFDGTQFGSPDLINDDVFALVPLLNAGLNEKDPAISHAVAFILSKQEKDGSWVGGADMTSAAVQALAEVPSLDGVSGALEKAKVYLKSKQDLTGGFDHNAFSTSWVMQGIKALGDDSSSWQRNGNTPGDYLSGLQAEDGGMSVEGDIATRLWATAYVLPATLQKPWSSILARFSHPSELSSQGSGENKPMPAPVHESKTTTAFFSDRYTLANKVRLQGSDLEETEASLSIPQGTTGKNESGSWGGEFLLRVATSTQAIANYLQKEIEQLPSPQGFLEVDTGKDSRLTFDKPLIISMPVFASEGTLLDVYTRSEGEETFHFLETCVVAHRLCEIHPTHLSQFVATAKKISESKGEKANGASATPTRLGQRKTGDAKVVTSSLIPAPGGKTAAQRSGKRRSAATLPFQVINETLPQESRKSPPEEDANHATSSAPLSSESRNLALANEARAIFPFALLATILLGAYLVRKYQTHL